jgi:hypothetical protein
MRPAKMPKMDQPEQQQLDHPLAFGLNTIPFVYALDCLVCLFRFFPHCCVYLFIVSVPELDLVRPPPDEVVTGRILKSLLKLKRSGVFINLLSKVFRLIILGLRRNNLVVLVKLFKFAKGSSTVCCD